MAFGADQDGPDDGFTLVELLIVVVIIGILIAVAIPLYLSYEHGAEDRTSEADLRSAIAAVQQCYLDEHEAFPAGAASGSGVAGANVVFDCPDNGHTETAEVSAGTVLTYTGTTDATSSVVGYTLTARNTGGSGKTYSYSSADGVIVGG